MAKGLTFRKSGSMKMCTRAPPLLRRTHQLAGMSPSAYATLFAAMKDGMFGDVEVK
jgi:hypothetical protein